MEIVALTPDKIEQFRDQGFMCLPQLSTAEEVDWMRGVCRRLFERRAGWQRGDLFDFAGVDDPGDEAVSPQLLSPSLYEPTLKDTVFRRNAHAMARQLLGPSAELVYEHLVLKPAKTGSQTPWHQDEAFFPKYTDYQSITFWMPLQAVDSTNGCLDFIPGSHKGRLLAHHRINDDPRIHGLEAEGADAGQSVACPLAAGEATIHHQRTLHHSAANLSDGSRYAYALAFGVRSRELTLREEFPWNLEKATARHRRAVEAQSMSDRIIRRVKNTVKSVFL
jgi:Phytanoyl-CoA dioxygenase (PhyH)